MFFSAASLRTKDINTITSVYVNTLIIFYNIVKKSAYMIEIAVQWLRKK